MSNENSKTEKKSVSEIIKSINRCNIMLDTKEEKISKLEDRSLENI